MNRRKQQERNGCHIVTETYIECSAECATRTERRSVKTCWLLEHYLRLIVGRLMEDKVIVELCQRIYKNHRQALQLIYQHAGSPAAGLLGKIESLISEHSNHWHIVNKTSKKMFFIPTQWLQFLPEIGARATFDPRCWVLFRFEIQNTKGFFGEVSGPPKTPRCVRKLFSG